MRDGVMLLSHGSRRGAANQEILAISELVKARDPEGLYQVAFMQFGQPDIGQALDQLIGVGVDRIIIMPLFLVTGNHITQDIPEEIQRQKERYPGVEFIMAQHLAGHPGLIDIILDRIKAYGPGHKSGNPDIIWDPRAIETRSMDIIESFLTSSAFSPHERMVVKRIVHTTGDPQIVELVRFHPQAVEVGIKALLNGAAIFTDVNMLKTGINRKKVEQSGGEIFCAIADPAVAQAAEEWGITRAAAAMRLYRYRLDQAVIAVGNAPTALFEVLNLVKAGVCRPALIVGTPVGFVGAAESKELLAAQDDIPFISLVGTRGGSPIAVSIINALLYHDQDGRLL